MKKIEDEFWSQSEAELMEPLNNAITMMVREIASERSQWVDEQLHKYVPAWQIWMMLHIESYQVRKLFGWRVEYSHYNQIEKTKISIYRFNKLLVYKIFKDAYYSTS